MFDTFERKASISTAWNVAREVSLCRPTCVCPEVRPPLEQSFCVVIVVKNVSWLGLTLVVFLYLVLHRSKIPLALTTKVTHLRSPLFRQQDGVNSVVKRVYLAITAKLVPME